MTDLSFILARLNLYSLIDILLVALIFYGVLRLIQGTQAIQLLRGILTIVFLATILGSFFEDLIAFRWLLDQVLPVALLSIPVIFQPELRRALDRLGSSGKFFASRHHQPDKTHETIDTVVTACISLADLYHGGLIVFERHTGLTDYADTGICLDAHLTPQLLTTIFSPNTPLHDGGIIIQQHRATAASVVFPLGDSVSINKYMLGTRHRAALGITQQTDAVAVVISEETGLISIAVDGELIRGLDEPSLRQTLFHYLSTVHSPKLSISRLFRAVPNKKKPDVL